MTHIAVALPDLRTPYRTDIRTEHFHAFLRPDGLQMLIWEPGRTIDAGLALAAIKAGEQISAGQRRGLLIDTRQGGVMDKDARRIFAAGGAALTAVALWVESPLSKVVANIFLGLNRTDVPVKMFTSERDAVAWLLARKR